MKRQAEFLVSKRDGRREWLRATKLARSIHLALRSAGVVERERSLDLATRLVARLRRYRRETVLETSRLASVVQSELIDRGYTLAALLYAEAAQRQQERVPSGAAPIDRVEPFWSDDRLFG